MRACCSSGFDVRRNEMHIHVAPLFLTTHPLDLVAIPPSSGIQQQCQSALAIYKLSQGFWNSCQQLYWQSIALNFCLDAKAFILFAKYWKVKADEKTLCHRKTLLSSTNVTVKTCRGLKCSKMILLYLRKPKADLTISKGNNFRITS